MMDLQHFLETGGNFQQNHTNVSKHDVFVEAVEETVGNLQQNCENGAEAVWKRLGITSEFVEAVEKEREIEYSYF